MSASSDEEKRPSKLRQILTGVAFGGAGLLIVYVLLTIALELFVLDRGGPPTSRPPTPPLTRTTGPGLGVNVAEMHVAFTHPEMGWVSIESAPMYDGTLRVLVKFDSGNAILEMIGPNENLTSVAVFVDDSIDSDSDFFMNALYLGMVLDLAVPRWNHSNEWLAVNIGIADEGGKPVMYYEGKTISLRAYPATETIMVKVEMDSPG